MGTKHCDGCKIKNTCGVNHASKTVPREPTMEEQLIKMWR